MKVTVQTFLTLDGVMQAPGGPEEDPSDAFAHGGWPAPFTDPAVGEFVTELNSHASAFLFGRRTFDIFRGHWPDQTDPSNPIATAINSLPKRSEEHTSELQSLMRISYAVFCLKKKLINHVYI